MFNLLDIFKKKEEEVAQKSHIVSAIEKAAKANTEISDDYKNGGSTDYNTDGEEYYTSSDLVNTCVNYIAETGALTEIKAGLMVDGKMVPLKDKKLKRLFEVAPNEFFTWQETLEQAIQSFLLTGNVFMSFEKLKNYEMWVLPTNDTVVVPNPTDFIDGYMFADKIAYSKEEMVHIRRGNIYNSHYGTPAILDVLEDYLNLEGAGMEDLKSFYDNSSVGSGVLETAFPLQKPQIDELRAQFKSAYGKNARHNTVILPQDIKYKSVKLSPKDSMLLDSFNITDDRVLRVFRLNSQVLGGSKGQFATNIEDVAKMVHTTAIMPIVEKIIKQLELFFRIITKKDNLVLYADYNKIPYISIISSDLANSVAKLVSTGIISYNEARILTNFVPKDDEAFDFNFVPSFLLGNQPVTLQNYDEALIASLNNSNNASGSLDAQGGDSEGQGEGDEKVE